MDPPKFEFIASTPWRMYPLGDEDDKSFYKENLTDYDSNEDHNCGFCGKDLLGRFLFCNKECSDKFDEMIAKDKSQRE